MFLDSAGLCKNKKSALKKGTKELHNNYNTKGEAMTPINKLLALMDWQDANRPLKVEEKAELIKLSDIEFEKQLHQMAVDFKNDGVIRA
jgi:hypothetical protein